MATFTLQDEEILRRAVATGEAGGGGDVGHRTPVLN